MALNATRLMLTAFRMSSIDISTMTPLRRAITPYTPMLNRMAARRRNSFRTIALLPPGDDDRPDQRGQEQQGHDLERQQVRGEDRVAHRAGVRRLQRRRELVATEEVDLHVGEEPEQDQCSEGADRPAVACMALLAL